MSLRFRRSIKLLPGVRVYLTVSGSNLETLLVWAASEHPGVESCSGASFPHKLVYQDH
jgi:hypothetical protein